MNEMSDVMARMSIGGAANELIGEKKKGQRRSKGAAKQRASQTKRQKDKHREAAAAEDGGR